MEKINGRTPEDLKDALMRCGRRHCKAESGDCPYYIDCLVGATRLKLMKDAFDYIRYLESERDAALAKVPKWISVKERLPVKQLRVIVQTGHGLVTTGWRSYHVDVRGGELWEVDGAHNYHNDVTHWMPLPQPPEEE